MITPSEADFIASHAYVPEHLPGYVTAISRAEPYLLGDYVCYRAEETLLFIGYPLRSPFDEKSLMEALRSAISRFKPAYVALTAPVISMVRVPVRERNCDHYYRLDLSQMSIPAKVRNMIRRASKELQVERAGEIHKEHTRLIREFLDSRQLREETRYIFERVPAYVSAVPTAEVFSARDGAGNLVAFDVAEFGSKEYAFYQFNFCSPKHYVPGASDLLLHEVLTTAQEKENAFINLGLGIHEGVAHFKLKWEGRPFLSYEFCRYQPSPRSLFESLLERL
ncbi:MAG: hypothetical protein HYY65_06020 [Candidatus Tectomicrobia bacterium]|uniref:BioF2-like acetyltransferase domain-containing protein n=1 Tax=Tectimicrobiota bacterium TaxID=2528274 RepID=A0A932M191_UNCTE|nr:hypothetical protein [Candidatus Tectomicrobia bacterium]